jgi:hypothetical protein
MKRTTRIITLAAFTLLALSITNLVQAGPALTFYLRTDRASYVPGDTGSLLITVRNEGDQAFTIKNLTINWPWMMFLNDHWDGNITINNINQAFAAGQAYNTAQSFTIPTDGRAYQFRTGTVRVGTDIGGNGGSYWRSSVFMTMDSPTYTPLGVSTQLFSIILVGILAVATVLLFLVNTALRKPRSSSTTR